MSSRILQALAAWLTFQGAAFAYATLGGHEYDALRVASWSALGIATYIVLSHTFGFDPHRSSLTASASALLRYVDRWELRLGQATLSMLGCVVLAVGVLDGNHFVLGVVSGTLAAWTYFVWRLYAGGYQTATGK